MTSIEKITKIAEVEVGYLEKKTNDNLDSKTANAGSANWTKYGKWIGVNGTYWCASFLSWLYYKTFGNDLGKKILCGQYSASCETIRQNFVKAGKYDKKPQVGDVIFFVGTRHSGANHIGYVYKVDTSKVYTIEGNTSGGNTVVDNGGGVAKKSYSISYAKILGYGHPKYSLDISSTVATTTSTTTATSSYTHKDFVKDVQTAIGAKVDGVAGQETLGKTITVSKSKNNKHAVVKPIQKYLNSIGYDCGTADGVAGTKFDTAVKAFQKANGCTVDGEITKSAQTWRCLLKL